MKKVLELSGHCDQLRSSRMGKHGFTLPGNSELNDKLNICLTGPDTSSTAVAAFKAIVNLSCEVPSWR